MAPRTPARARGVLGQLPSSPRKGLGQHFLVDRSVLRTILEAAEVSASDTVLEVGAGSGVLTQALAARAGRVVALELDVELARGLQRAFAANSKVRVVQGDARTVDLATLLGGPGITYKVVANLPYYAAQPILRRFLEEEPRPRLLVVMVQREVGQEMAAAPGAMGLLSVAIQVYAVPRLVAKVRPRAFYPPPKVTSILVRLDVHPQPLVPPEQTKGFFRVVRAGFSARRKTLRNALTQGLALPPAMVEALLLRAGIGPTRRAQELALEEWQRLAATFMAMEVGR